MTEQQSTYLGILYSKPQAEADRQRSAVEAVAIVVVIAAAVASVLITSDLSGIADRLADVLNPPRV